jgi:diguanylate cyclase (GGDEF)-like protein
VLANAAWSSAAGQAPGAAEGQTDHDLFDHDVAEAILANDLAVLAANVARRDEGLMGPPDAPEKPVVVTTFPLRRDDGTAWGIGGIVTDVSELAAARGAEARQAGRLAAVFAASPTPLMRIEMRGPGEWTVLDVNDAFRRTLQGTLPERPSDTVAGMLSSDDLALTRAVVLEAWGRPAAGAATSRTRREIAVTTQDGRTVWVLLSAAPVGPPDADGGREIIVQLEDVSARREAERALSHQALTDAVTGLPNRNALTDRLEASLARLRRTPSTTCILFCDVDHFKVVNDTLGHLAGDAFLGEVARRLTAGTDATDLVARIGGDEFVVLLESVNEPTDAVLVAHRLKDEIARSWAHEGHVFHLTVSMGVATTGDPDASIDDLLRRADIAMYRAKDRGRDRVEMYDQSFDEELGHALTMQQWLREALSGDGLVLHYQPVVSLTDGRVVGAEALLRMRGPDGALVPPVEFLPHAEASGLITRVGAWVLDQALVDLRQWHDRGLDHTLAINVSPTQLNQEGFAADLLARVREAGVDPGSLCVEVTETVLVQDDDRVSGVLSQLHDAGVRIALDDFGTGYSSLSWLLEFPVDLVKIDRSFVRDLGVDVRRTAIVEAVLQVSHRTGLRVVAEGIETQDQADRLLEMGCRLGQGYLLGRPVPLTEPPWAPDLAGAPPSDAAARP